MDRPDLHSGSDRSHAQSFHHDNTRPHVTTWSTNLYPNRDPHRNSNIFVGLHSIENINDQPCLYKDSVFNTITNSVSHAYIYPHTIVDTYSHANIDQHLYTNINLHTNVHSYVHADIHANCTTPG